MFQDVSPQKIATDSSEDALSMQPWSMEVDAERLMNDLFDDIDRVLETGGTLPTEPLKPESISLQPLKISPLDLPATLVPLVSAIASPVVAEPSPVLATTDPTPTPVEETVAVTSPPAEPRRRSERYLDNLLLLAIGTSVTVPVMLWVMSHGGFNVQFQNLRQAFEPQPTTPQLDPQAIASADAQFSNYMQRSLQLLDQQAAERRKMAAVSPSGTESTPSPSAATNPPATVLERVYIPVYQPPTPLATRPAPSPPSANPAPANSIQPSAPVAIAPAPSALPALQPSSPVVPPAPIANSTLVGLLELGDRSVALFEINGSTQRYKVGETIGSSGWTLVEIKNQEALIRRNGEVRSVYVGQKF